MPKPKVKPWPECRRWTAEEDRIATTLPPEEAAQKLGRTVKAVQVRRSVINATQNWNWTPDEDRIVTAMKPRFVAKLLPGRTVGAIRGRRDRLRKQPPSDTGLKRKRKKTYRRLSPALETSIRRRIENGERKSDVARSLGISRQTVHAVLTRN